MQKWNKLFEEHCDFCQQKMIPEESGWISVMSIGVNDKYALRLVTSPVRIYDVKYYLTSNSLNHEWANQSGQVKSLVVFFLHLSSSHFLFLFVFIDFFIFIFVVQLKPFNDGYLSYTQV